MKNNKVLLRAESGKGMEFMGNLSTLSNRINSIFNKLRFHDFIDEEIPDYYNDKLNEAIGLLSELQSKLPKDIPPPFYETDEFIEFFLSIDKRLKKLKFRPLLGHEVNTKDRNKVRVLYRPHGVGEYSRIERGDDISIMSIYVCIERIPGVSDRFNVSLGISGPHPDMEEYFENVDIKILDEKYFNPLYKMLKGAGVWVFQDNCRIEDMYIDVIK